MSDKIEQETDIDLLRNILLGDEKSKIDNLEKHFDDPIKHIQDVSSVLPQAVKLSVSHNDKLSNELMPVVEKAIKSSIKRDVRVFADALYPIMGPAIRKSISETFLEMIQSLNKVLEHSFSWKGIKWRFEAWKTRKSFAEVVLLHSLVYRVEQVFLIQKKTGLLLHHTSMVDVVTQDSDLISAMLTAIQDFVHDSFNESLSESSDKHPDNDIHNLNKISMGEFSIWIEQGPDAVIAVVLKGTAPKSLRQELITTLENIHLQYAEEMQNFSGDQTEFSQLEEHLQGCLLSQYQSENKKISWALWGLLGAMLLGIIIWLFIYVQEIQRWQDYRHLIKSEPGIVVTDITTNNGQYFIHGLRDPLARAPEDILSDSSLTLPITLGSYAVNLLTEEQISHHFEPYQSLTEEFIQKRAVQILQAPDSVNIRVAEGILLVSGNSSLSWKRKLIRQSPYISGINYLDSSQLKAVIDLSSLNAPDEVNIEYDKGLLNVTGTASNDWIKNLKSNALSIIGVEKINMDELINSDQQLIKRLTHEIEAESFYYEAGETIFAEKSADKNRDEKLSRIVSKIRLLVQLTKRLSMQMKIVVQGFSDSVGHYNARLNISYLRAENMRQFLISNGINNSFLEARSMVTKNETFLNSADYDISHKRRVSFSVNFLNDFKGH